MLDLTQLQNISTNVNTKTSTKFYLLINLSQCKFMFWDRNAIQINIKLSVL